MAGLGLVEWLGHTAVAAVQVLSWLGLGTLLLRPLATGKRAVDALNRLGAGAVGFALLTFAAGLAGVLYPAVIVAATLLAASGGALVVARGARTARVPEVRLPRWQLALALLLLGTAALAIFTTGAPVSGYDALTYHVSVPAVYEQGHKMVELPWNWSSYQPFTVEMLITDGLLLWDPVQGAFAPLALVLGAAAAVVVGGWLVGGVALALLAGAIFFTQPLVAWEATAALVDGGVAFAVALTALNLVVWSRTRRTSALALAGLFAGASAGMKYHGLFAALAAGTVVLLAAGRGRRAAAVVAFAAPAALVACPWYAKNWILTGNPFFPFVFGGLNESAAHWIDAALGDYGYGHTPLDALLLPIRLVTDSGAFDGAGWLSPLVLVFPLLALLDRDLRRAVSIALAGCAVYVGLWFATSQQARFLIPVLPVLSVLAAVGLRELTRAGRAGRLVAAGAAAGTLAAGFVIFAAYGVQFVPVVAGFQSKEDFLADRTAYYDGVVWLNRELDESDRVLIDFASPYLEPRYVVWTPLVLPNDAAPNVVRRFVGAKQLRYVAVLAVNRPDRQRALASMRARRVATLDVHTAFLGLRRWGGIPDRLFVYRLPGPRDASEPLASPRTHRR